MKRFSYKIIRCFDITSQAYCDTSEKEINKLGGEGFKIISVTGTGTSVITWTLEREEINASAL